MNIRKSIPILLLILSVSSFQLSSCNSSKKAATLGTGGSVRDTTSPAPPAPKKTVIRQN